MRWLDVLHIYIYIYINMLFGSSTCMISLDSYETKGAPLTASCFTTTNSSFPLHTLAKTSSAPWPLASKKKKTSAATEGGKGGIPFFHCYVFCRIDLDFWRMKVILKSNQIAQKIQFEWIFGIQKIKLLVTVVGKITKIFLSKGGFSWWWILW